MRRCTAVCAAASLERFVLETASGEYHVDGAGATLCERMELDVASGSVSVSQMSVTDLELSLASGNVAYEGSVAKTLHIDQASGEVLLRPVLVGPGDHLWIACLRTHRFGATGRYRADGAGG